LRGADRHQAVTSLSPIPVQNAHYNSCLARIQCGLRADEQQI
jgi:hypothetical protein